MATGAVPVDIIMSGVAEHGQGVCVLQPRAAVENAKPLRWQAMYFRRGMTLNIGATSAIAAGGMIMGRLEWITINLLHSS
jgi:hypothetical protein